MSEGKPFKISTEMEDGTGPKTTISLEIEGDVTLGLELTKLAIDRHLGVGTGHATAETAKRGAGRPAGLTKEVLAARNGGTGAPNIAARMTG